MSRLRHLKRFALGIQSCKRADNQIFRDYIESPPPSEPIYLQFQVRLYYYSCETSDQLLLDTGKGSLLGPFFLSVSRVAFLLLKRVHRVSQWTSLAYSFTHMDRLWSKIQKKLLKLIAIFPKILKTNRIFRVRVNKSCS